MKKTVIILISILVLCIFALILTCVYLVDRKSSVKDPEITIRVGETYDLNLSEIFSDSKCSWSSGNDDIASVDDTGIVTGKKIGETIISCKLKKSGNDLTLRFRVTVT